MSHTGTVRRPNGQVPNAQTDLGERVGKLYTRGVIAALSLMIGFLLVLKYFGPPVLDIEVFKWIVYIWGFLVFLIATVGLCLAVWVHDRRARAEREALIS